MEYLRSTGLDLVTGARQAKLQVPVDAMLGGKATQLRIGVPMDGGVRLKTGSLVSDAAMGVSRIDRLFGRALSSGRIES
jgi:hypothetical protein